MQTQFSILFSQLLVHSHSVTYLQYCKGVRACQHSVLAIPYSVFD